MGKLDAQKDWVDNKCDCSLDGVEWSTINPLPLQSPHLLLHRLSWFLCGRLQLSKTFLSCRGKRDRGFTGEI